MTAKVVGAIRPLQTQQMVCHGLVGQNTGRSLCVRRKEDQTGRRCSGVGRSADADAGVVLVAGDIAEPEPEPESESVVERSGGTSPLRTALTVCGLPAVTAIRIGCVAECSCSTARIVWGLQLKDPPVTSPAIRGSGKLL